MTRDISSWLQADVVMRVKDLSLTIVLGMLVFVVAGMICGLKKHDLLRGAK